MQTDANGPRPRSRRSTRSWTWTTRCSTPGSITSGRASSGTYQHMDADEDMSEETPTQRLNDAIRMQKRLYNILRCKEAT